MFAKLFAALSLTAITALSQAAFAHDSTGGDSPENYTCADLQAELAQRGSLTFFYGTILGLPSYETYYATPERLFASGACPSRHFADPAGARTLDKRYCRLGFQCSGNYAGD